VIAVAAMLLLLQLLLQSVTEALLAFW